jgi:hypothetical protein
MLGLEDILRHKTDNSDKKSLKPFPLEIDEK